MHPGKSGVMRRNEMDVAVFDSTSETVGYKAKSPDASPGFLFLWKTR
jgi:hypothetical protein